MAIAIIKKRGQFWPTGLLGEESVSFSIEENSEPIDPKELVELGPTENYKDEYYGDGNIQYDEMNQFEIPCELRRDGLIRIQEHINNYAHSYAKYVLITCVKQVIVCRDENLLLTQAVLIPYAMPESILQNNLVSIVPVGEKAYTYTYARLHDKVPEDRMVTIPLFGDLPVLKRTPADNFLNSKPEKYNSLLMIAVDHGIGWEDLYIYWIEERREWIGITDTRLNPGQWLETDPVPAENPINGPYRLCESYAKKIIQAYNIPKDTEVSWSEILHTSPAELERLAAKAMREKK